MKNKLVIKADTIEERLVYGEVYAPSRPDSDGEFMTAVEIQKMAHDFVRKQRMDQVDQQHQNGLTDGVVVVESFVARKGDPDFIEGSWVVGVHIPDDATWDKVKKGEINGFSMEAYVTREDTIREVEYPPVVTGKTTKGDNHEHTFYVTYSDDGVFLGGVTSETNGHVHKIIKGTATETAHGHLHTFSSVDGVSVK